MVWGDLKAEFMLFMFYFALVKKSIHESFGILFLLGASKKKEEKRRMKQKEEGEEEEERPLTTVLSYFVLKAGFGFLPL